jgi:hypothetical protein
VDHLIDAAGLDSFHCGVMLMTQIGLGQIAVTPARIVRAARA